ncbi:PREDICTED: DNA primase small subunit-like [Priapulus caudatus]|uniref:DNA primase n=1 Tax=Priapulus caudatus TaxID=37621 RepID=A0ABM1E900_PRICU|nr:PREDICTED: DNA primase small subunit-like [Priapulus caudatus]
MDDEHSKYDPAILPDYLPIYYRRLFPYKEYFRWLSYGNANGLVSKSTFQNREFSFTLKDDIYIRYQSFADQAELEKEIIKRCPYKIDIGAVYTSKPKDRSPAITLTPVEKELVFDIDMTDYDDVRTCCSGADICHKCWPFMTLAIKVIDRALKDDFGFQHRLWVYSGRRGVHCWVCDEEARKLSVSARSAVAEYLTLIKGGNTGKKFTLYENVHPLIQESYTLIKKGFLDLAIVKQDFLGSKVECNKFLKFIVDDGLRKLLEAEFESLDTSKQRWASAVNVVRTTLEQGSLKRNGRHCIEEVMLSFCYPRLDINVTKGLNHLLKSPFCIHPKTGRVCVPIDPEDADSFDPFTVPTISQLVDEFNEYEEKNKGSGDTVRDVKKTSLQKSLKIFEKFLRKLEASWTSKKIEQNEATMEF